MCVCVCVWVGVMEGGGAVLAMKFVGQTFKLEACYMYFTGSFLGLIQFCFIESIGLRVYLLWG